MLKCLHLRILLTLVSLPPLLAFVCNPVAAATLAEKYPKEKAAFPLIEKHPLLKEILKSIQDRTGKPPFFIRPPDERSDKVRKVFDPKLYDAWTNEKFPSPAAGAKPYRDADLDGMPDWWEKEHGFDVKAVGDGALDKDGDGYTNVEEFINDTDPNQFADYTLARNNIHSLHKKDCIHSAQWRKSHPKE